MICKCGHWRNVHKHYRRGTDCAFDINCRCLRFVWRFSLRKAKYRDR